MKAFAVAAFSGLAALASGAVSPASSATYVVWQGDAVILSATPQCAAGANERAKIAKGTVLLSVVRPALIASNGNDSRISFNHDRQGEFALDLAGGLTIAGSGTYTSYGVTSSGVIKANVGGTYGAFALTPPTPTPGTSALTLIGTIDNFMFVSGCTVTFRAGYTLRV